MRWPWVSRKTHESEVKKLEICLADWMEAEKSAGYHARKEAFAEYREWIVDLNYNLFNSDDRTLRPKIYGALTDGTHKFDPKEIKE